MQKQMGHMTFEIPSQWHIVLDEPQGLVLRPIGETGEVDRALIVTPG